MKITLLVVAILTVCVELLPPVSLAGRRPSIVGRVVLTVGSTARVPLGSVSLRLISNGKPVQTTYTDSRGNFAFYGVQRGTYEIQVIAGVLRQGQQVQRPSILNQRTVQFTGVELKLPDIVVSKRGF